MADIVNMIDPVNTSDNINIDDPVNNQTSSINPVNNISRISQTNNVGLNKSATNRAKTKNTPLAMQWSNVCNLIDLQFQKKQRNSLSPSLEQNYLFIFII